MRNIIVAARQHLQSSFQTRPFSAFILAFLTLSAPIYALAQTGKPRPLPRLVSSSRQVAPPVSKPRLIASIPMSQIPEMSRSSASARRVSSSPAPNYSSSSAFAGAASLERRAFDLVNSERRARGESPLQWDASLSQLARQHSLDMARSGNFNHRGLDGRDMAERARAAGIRGWRVLGENIAFNQGFNDPSAFAVERWMGSSKHRANILNGQFTRTGIGVARAADGSIYFTQVFMS